MAYFWEQERLEPPEDDVVCMCSRCCGEIYRGEDWCEDEHGAVCCDCLDEEWKSLDMWAKSQVMGYELHEAIHAK